MAHEMIEIGDVKDERLDIFRDVLRRRAGEDDMSARFVVEGMEPVKRFVNACAGGDHFVVDAIVCEKGRVERVIDACLATTIYVVDRCVMDELCGFKFTRGLMACGRMVKKYELCDFEVDAASGRNCVLICEHCENEENLGAMIRTAAALGAGGVVLGEKGVSPFARRVVRVSMGNVFNLPIVRSVCLSADLAGLQKKGWSVVGAALTDDAVDLRDFQCGNSTKIALVVGNEPEGMSKGMLDLCDAKAMVPVVDEADSLNVSVAAGIMMWRIMCG